jgi:hypothetical protein
MPADAHPTFKAPANREASLWRYMDFTKYVSMLEVKALFLARVDQFGDAFEGAWPRHASVSGRKALF